MRKYLYGMIIGFGVGYLVSYIYYQHTIQPLKNKLERLEIIVKEQQAITQPLQSSLQKQSKNFLQYLQTIDDKLGKELKKY